MPTDVHGYVARAPDLAVEGASASQLRPEMADKARLWLARVWRPGDQTLSQTLGLADSLDGLDVVPGFTYPLAKLLA